MKVYLVYGDTYFEQCGSDFHLFGVFTSKQAAEEVKKQKEDEFYHCIVNFPGTAYNLNFVMKREVEKDENN